MKKLILGFILLSTIACNESLENTVGSKKDVPIENVSFSVDTTYLESNTMVAKGEVTNLGTQNIYPSWFVEAQFYTNDRYTTKLGGNYIEIKVPLSPMEGTFWTIKFSSTNVDVKLYPNFRISQIRAIYKE